MINSSTNNSSTTTFSSDLKQLIAHKLAHSIRNENTDEFLSIYDKIPSHLDQFTLDSIKETARYFSEISLNEFQNDCSKLNCTYDNQIEMNDSATSKTSSKSTDGGDIVRNESFFNEKSNQTNPVYNPLLLTSNNKFHNVATSSSSSTSLSKITISNTQLYKDNFSETMSTNSTSSSNSNEISNTNQQKCRFVTNQLYQNKKDSQHNETVLSNCFDEVVPANQTDNESDSDSYYDDDKKESISTSSSTNSSVTSNSPATEQQSVIIDIEDDDEDDLDEYNSNTNKNKEKFENLVQSKEKTKQKIELINDADMNEIIASEPVHLTENKYEKDDQLLKSYKDECKYGYTNPHRDRAKQILNKTTTNEQQVTMTTASTIETKSIMNDKRYSASSSLSASSSSSNNPTSSSMKSDFNKNEEDEDDEDYDENVTQPTLLNCHDNASNKNIKTLLNNKKPPPPPTTTNTTTSSSHTSLYNPDELLSSLVTILNNKNKPNSSATPTKPSYQPLQFNNYKTDIDLNSNFGLNYADSSISEHKSSSLVHTSDIVLNIDEPNKKSSISSSSSTSSSSSSSSVLNRPSNINRRSAEAYMDSHGSSLTNSSKQEEDDDLEDDETNSNTNNNNNNANLSDNDTNEFSLLNKTNIFKNQASNNYGSIKNDNNNQLKQTIESLSQVHVDKAKLEASKKATYLASSATLPNSNINTTKPLTSTTTTSNSSSLTNSKLTSNKSNNSGVFHQKYASYQYEPTDSTTTAAPTSKTISQTLHHLDPSNESSSTLLSSSQPNNNTNKFSNFLNNKSNKRNNKKKLKASLELNNPDGDGSNDTEKNKYSEHYSEDIDLLLQFITSSDNNKNNNINTNNKTVKQSQQSQSNKKQQQQQQQTQPPPPQQQIQSKSLEKTNIKSTNKNKTESAKSTTTDDKLENNTQEIEQKEKTATVSQLVITSKQEEIKKESFVTNNINLSKPDELDLLNEINFITNSNSNLNTSGEFVTVKGRKLRKTNKKEYPQPTSLASQPTSSSTSTNNNNQSKSLNNTNTTIKLTKTANTTNPTNKKPDSIKPLVTNNNESKSKQPQSQQTASKQQQQQPQLQQINKLKESLPIRVSSSGPAFTTSASVTQPKLPTMDQPIVNDFVVNEFPPLLPSKPFSSIVAQSIQITQTPPVVVSTSSPLQPPPLSPKTLVSTTTQETKQNLVKEETKEIKVDVNSDSSKPLVVTTNLDESKPQSTIPPSSIQENLPTIINKPLKKSKFEFSTQRSKNSVIFLDEINQTNSNKTDSNSINSENTNLANANKKNILNGIKFGFIDSSSDEEEQQQDVVSCSVNTKLVNEETSTPSTKENESLLTNLTKKEDEIKFDETKKLNSTRNKKKFNTKLKQTKSTNSSTSTSSDDDSDNLNSNNNSTIANTLGNANLTNRKLKKKNKKNQKLKAGLPSTPSSNTYATNKQKSSDESLSNNERVNKLKPVNILNPDNSYATTTNASVTTVPTLSLLNNIPSQPTPNYNAHPMSMTQVPPHAAQAQPLIFYQNQMNAYLAAYYAGYHPQGLIPQGAPNPQFIPSNLMPQYIQQQQQQFYQQYNYYHNNNNNNQTNKPTQQNVNENKPNETNLVENATNTSNQQQSSTNSSTNSTPTPQTTNQSEQIVPTNPTLVQINPEYYNPGVAPPLSAGYPTPPFIAQAGPFGYSYIAPVPIDYIQTPVIAPNPITSPTGNETLIQMPLQPAPLIHLPPSIPQPPQPQHLPSNPNNILSPPIQTSIQPNESINSNSNVSTTSNNGKKEIDGKPIKNRYANQSYRNNNQRNNYHHHSHYTNLAANPQNYYFNGHHHQQHHHHPNGEYYTTRMPLYYPGNPNLNTPLIGTPIADAIQVAYADTPAYKGDFNLDETAYYVAKQWNNMKLAESNTNTNASNRNQQ